MKYYLISLIYLFMSCRNESKAIQPKPLEISTPINYINSEQDPTYGETVDWVLEKLNLYAEGYDREYYKNSEFEEVYPNVRMTYEKINIQYGKIFITENYRYYGANLSKENKYEGYIIRQNVQEIPINDIKQIELYKGEYFCNLKIHTKSSAVKFTRNLQIASNGIDLGTPKPIVEYDKRGAVYFRCETEPDLEKRLIKAFTHLKKLNLKRHPEKNEKF